MPQRASDIFDEIEIALNDLGNNFRGLEVFLGLACWDERDPWRSGYMPCPPYESSLNECVESVGWALSNAFDLLIDLPRIVRSVPVRFNNHTCLSYSDCVVEVCNDISHATMEWRKNDADEETRTDKLAERVYASISEWNGIENLRSTTTRPFRAVVVAALTEIHAELLRPGFADQVDASKLRRDQMKENVETLTVLEDQVSVASLGVIINDRSRYLQRSGYDITTEAFPERQAWPMLQRILKAAESGCRIDDLIREFDSSASAVYQALKEIRHRLSPIGLTVSDGRRERRYRIIEADPIRDHFSGIPEVNC